MGRPKKKTAEAVIKDIKRQTRKKYTTEEKIRIVLECLRGDSSISEVDKKVLHQQFIIVGVKIL